MSKTILPQEPAWPESIQGFAEAEAQAEAAHARLAGLDQRIADARRAVEQASDRRADLQDRLTAGGEVSTDDIASASASLQAAESTLAMLTDARPDFYRQVDEAEAQIVRLAAAAHDEHLKALSAWVKEMQDLQERIRKATEPVQVLLFNIRTPILGQKTDPAQHVGQFSPASAARQQAWTSRKLEEAEARRLEKQGEEIRARIAEQADRSRKEREERAAQTKEAWKFWNAHAMGKL